jgi:hypothetical protein
MANDVRIATPSADAAALKSLKDWALRLQSSEESIPRSVASQIPMAIRAAQRSILPADPKALAIEVAQLEEWAAAFNMPEADWKAATGFYRESLGHLPSDLLTEAFRAVRATHKWGMRLPLPSELLAAVSDRLDERKLLIAKLEIAKRCPAESDSRPPPSEAEKQRVAELLSQWRTGRSTTATPT